MLPAVIGLSAGAGRGRDDIRIVCDGAPPSPAGVAFQVGLHLQAIGNMEEVQARHRSNIRNSLRIRKRHQRPMPSQKRGRPMHIQ